MLIKVKVYPGEKEDKVIKKSEDSFELRVKEKPVMGQANRAVVWLLSLYFGVTRDKIRIVRGFKQRNKIIEINGREKR